MPQIILIWATIWKPDPFWPSQIGTEVLKMGEEDANIPGAEDTIVLTAEDMNQILEEASEDETSKEDEDGSS